MPPILRIEGENGTAWYPRFHKNKKGERELKDAEYWRGMIALQDSRRQSQKEKD
jgi:hypothetical protein